MPRRRRKHRTERARRTGNLRRDAHPDWEGGWRLDSSPSRTETGDLAYSPYGAAYAGSGPDAFTGQWVDTPDNLNDFQHRLLAPMMDRWLSPDPAGTAAVSLSNPQTWNAYAYVANRPLTATDPEGLTCAAGQCSSINGNALIERWESSEVDLLDNNLGCQIDGMDASCTAAEDMISDGSGVQCPNNYCGNGTKDPFTCLGNNCGYWTMQYTASHEYDCAGGLPCTESEWNGYQKALETEQASDIADWLNAWAAADCPACAPVTAQDLLANALHAQGGNENFNLGAVLSGWDITPPLGRYGGLDGSMHIEMWNGYREGHWDAANPWADFPIGLAIHFTVNVVLGTLNGMGGALY